jgi:hypothetical protein
MQREIVVRARETEISRYNKQSTPCIHAFNHMVSHLAAISSLSSRKTLTKHSSRYGL